MTESEEFFKAFTSENEDSVTKPSGFTNHETHTYYIGGEMTVEQVVRFLQDRMLEAPFLKTCRVTTLSYTGDSPFSGLLPEKQRNATVITIEENG